MSARSKRTRATGFSAGRDRHRSVRMLGLGLTTALLLTACGSSEEPSALAYFINSIKETYRLGSDPGAILVKKKCVACHNIDNYIRKSGPSLKGIVGRAPTSQGIPFARWNEQTLDLWLKDPAKVKPGTAMVFPGVKSVQQRRDIIAYLKQL